MRTLTILFLLTSASYAEEERHIDIHVQSVFYNDNTEFFSGFRDGETVAGNFTRVYSDISLSKNAYISAGIVVNRAYGSDKFFDLARPVISLVVGTKDNRLVLGTLETWPVKNKNGYENPHGLLPPLQVETLAFKRPNETGLQVFTKNSWVDSESWINWQQLNTPEHREKFDAGFVGTIKKIPIPYGVTFQGHIVHHGGQLYATGPVSDSFVFGPGFILEDDNPTWPESLKFETYFLISEYIPNREVDDSLTGYGIFFRASMDFYGLENHLILWQSKNFIKSEGDSNYGSLLLDGNIENSTHHYIEMSTAKHWKVGDNLDIEGSLHLHFVDAKLDYSYRIMGVIDYVKLIK